MHIRALSLNWEKDTKYLCSIKISGCERHEEISKKVSSVPYAVPYAPVLTSRHNQSSVSYRRYNMTQILGYVKKFLLPILFGVLVAGLMLVFYYYFEEKRFIDGTLKSPDFVLHSKIEKGLHYSKLLELLGEPSCIANDLEEKCRNYGKLPEKDFVLTYFGLEFAKKYLVDSEGNVIKEKTWFYWVN